MQIDPGSAINRMPLRALSHQGIPTSKLSLTKMTIQGYNADSLREIGKIRLKCQLADLKSEITCYVIDNERHVLQSTSGKALDSRELCCSVHPLSMLQICRRGQKSTNKTVFADRKSGSKLIVQIPSFMTRPRVTTLVQKKR